MIPLFLNSKKKRIEKLENDVAKVKEDLDKITKEILLMEKALKIKRATEDKAPKRKPRKFDSTNRQ